MQDRSHITPTTPAEIIDITQTRATFCSCGRPAREVLDGGDHGPTGYCGTPQPPLHPCDCGKGAERHDRTVCHIYGRGQLATLLMHRAVLEHGADVDFGVHFDDAGMWLRRPAWCTSGEQWDEYRTAQRDWWNAAVQAASTRVTS